MTDCALRSCGRVLCTNRASVFNRASDPLSEEGREVAEEGGYNDIPTMTLAYLLG